MQEKFESVDQIRFDPGSGEYLFAQGTILLSPAIHHRDRVETVPLILVVEDDWLLRRVLEDAFTEAGWAVHGAESGETALEMLASDERVDLLVTDIRLGGALDGWAWQRRFAQRIARCR